VQIKIENRHNNLEALNIIDTKIQNLKEKVQCLTQYVPKLLKKKDESGKKVNEQEMRKLIAERQSFQKRIMEIVKDIAWGLVDYIKHGKKFE
jgi:adenosyl cobinamide kinase/adenosyl cobinamide phosphate guanylyltransferase